jgi:hypothetical protein
MSWVPAQSVTAGMASPKLMKSGVECDPPHHDNEDARKNYQITNCSRAKTNMGRCDGGDACMYERSCPMSSAVHDVARHLTHWLVLAKVAVRELTVVRPSSVGSLGIAALIALPRDHGLRTSAGNPQPLADRRATTGR